ncbi:hypothetical protein [Streptomyces sp. NPDC047841]|uniref:wHTH domain-containing protein n=1 Tax=Streptomyces sp. NPDC047841 TaxID=3154708 RepID=UPI003451E99B
MEHAGPGDHLLLVLSGHGSREDGSDLLGRLGYSVRDLDEHPGRPRDCLDMALTSLEDHGGPPWLDADHRVPWHHVLRGADTCRLTTDEVVERLARCGDDVTPEPLAGDRTQQDDVFLLRNGRRHADDPWHPVNTPAPTAVARRLGQLGHVLPEDVEFTEPAVR